MQVDGRRDSSELPGRGKRPAAAGSRALTALDALLMVLLLAAPLGGMIAFGAVRMWSFGPLMFLVFLAAGGVFLRPLFFPDLRRVLVPPGGLVWLAFLLYGAARIPQAAVPYEARIEMLRAAGLLAAYWAWTDLASRAGRWRILLGTVVLAVSLLCWYAVIQHAHGSRMVLNLERPDIYGMRASSTYFCPNHFASLLEIMIPVSLVLLFTRSAGFPLRLLAGYGLLLFLPVMYLTQSRSGWLGTAAGLAVAACLLAYRKSRRLFLGLAVLIPVVLLFAGLLLWRFSPVVRERVAGASLRSPDPAVQARFLMWKDSRALIGDKPWLGHGPGAFAWVYPRYKTHSAQFFFNYAHNEYLHGLADYGVVGLALMAAVFAAAGGRLLSRLRAAGRDRDAALIAGLSGSVVAVLVHALFDFNLHIFANTQMLVLVAGVTAGGLYGSGELPERPARSATGRWLWGGAALVSFALALAVLQAVSSYGLWLTGEGDRLAVRMPEALRRFERATRLDPGNWAPYLGIGLTRQAQAFWNLDPEEKKKGAAEARDAFQEVLARNPLSLEALFGLSKAYNMLGDPALALEQLEKARNLDRHHLFYAQHLGLQLSRMGRDAEALQVFEEAYRIHNNNEMLQLNIRRLRERLGPEGGSGKDQAPDEKASAEDADRVE